MIGFSPRQASAVLDAAHEIERSGPPLLQMTSRWLGIALRLVPLHHRRTVALAVAEIAMRHSTPASRSTAA